MRGERSANMLRLTTMSDFQFQDMLPLAHDETPYRCLTTDHVSTFEAAGKTFLQVEPAGPREA